MKLGKKGGGLEKKMGIEETGEEKGP